MLVLLVLVAGLVSGSIAHGSITTAHLGAVAPIQTDGTSGGPSGSGGGTGGGTGGG